MTNMDADRKKNDPNPTMMSKIPQGALKNPDVIRCNAPSPSDQKPHERISTIIAA